MYPTHATWTTHGKMAVLMVCLWISEKRILKTRLTQTLVSVFLAEPASLCRQGVLAGKTTLHFPVLSASAAEVTKGTVLMKLHPLQYGKNPSRMTGIHAT